jgi:PemK-like, MazF-like toxin of type II toxin-antitoxin system
VSTTSRLLAALVNALKPRKKAREAATRGRGVPKRREVVGQRGEAVEVDPSGVGPVRMTYSPDLDGAADPGEIVWTWVPYEEHDGRGKDRPVLIVAAEKRGSLLAVQLTSRNHAGDAAFVDVGAGDWDSQGRRSWANIDRVFRLTPTGIRREATALDGSRYRRVEAAIHRRYGWS